MKNKNLLIGLLSLAVVLIASCSNTGGTGAATATCPVYDCVLTTTQASFQTEVIDEHGIGCATDCQADVRVKNLENQPTRVAVSAECQTVNKKGIYTSETYWMQPNSEYDFKIKVDAGFTENWKCENFVVNSDKISSCQTIIKN